RGRSVGSIDRGIRRLRLGCNQRLAGGLNACPRLLAGDLEERLAVGTGPGHVFQNLGFLQLTEDMIAIVVRSTLPEIRRPDEQVGLDLSAGLMERLATRLARGGP